MAQLNRDELEELKYLRILANEIRTSIKEAERDISWSSGMAMVPLDSASRLAASIVRRLDIWFLDR
jgi:hypothetical protein